MTLIKNNIMLLFAYGNFWSAVCVSLQAPFFPREAELKGATPTEYGLVFGIYELIIILFSPLCGKLIGRIPTKSMISMGLFIIGLSVITFGFLDKVPYGKPFITLAYIVRIFEAFGAILFSVANFTAVASLFPDNVATAFSILETGFGLGLIAGPTVGSFLYELGGYTLPFTVLGSFLLAGSIGSMFLLPNPPATSDRGPEDNCKLGIFQLVADVGCILDLLAIVSSFTFLGFNAATLEPHLRKFDIGVLAVGFLFIIDGGFFALTSPIVGKICDIGFNPKIIIIVGHFLMTLGIIFIGPSPFLPLQTELWLVVLSLISLGCGVGLKFVPAFYNTLSEAVHTRGFPDDKRTYALVSSVVFSCGSLGSFLGPSIGGWLYENYGYRMGTSIFFLVELTLGLVALMYSICNPRKAFIRRCMSQDSIDIEKSLIFSEVQPLLAPPN